MRVTQLASWQALERAAERLREERIETLFNIDPHRVDYLAMEAAGLYVDLSKHLVDRSVVTALIRLADERSLSSAIDAMMSGHAVNATQNRPALHALLRSIKTDSDRTAHTDRMDQIAVAHRKMDQLGERIENGQLVGYDGSIIRDIVNIGIGGSHLGPQMVCDALRYERNSRVNVHFVANVDGGDLDRVITTLDPKSTFFIVASKSFATTETLLNAKSASTWIQNHFNDPAATHTHFAAVTAMPDRAIDFGIDQANIFPMWDWVGGRFSLWSTIGLPIALAVGADGFRQLLAGAQAMDQHFATAELAVNIPVMLALISIWNNNFLGYDTLAIVPYDDRLRRLPEYLQQLEMESNGKRITLDNEVVNYATAPVLWGGTGTNVQHAFFQALHQGTRRTATDFIMVLNHPHAAPDHHDALVANCIAQAEGLMKGRPAKLIPDIDNPNAAIDLPLHRETPGNRPSTMLVLDALTPASLGALLALYEHKTYVQGVIWNINSFDQWGVELGKDLADSILDEFRGAPPQPHDSSSSALVARYLKARNR